MLVQRVMTAGAGGESWTVLDRWFVPVEPIEAFCAYLSAIQRSPGTVRSYAFDLRDLFVFLDGHGISWTAVDLEDLGRFVAWLRLPPAARRGEVAAFPSVQHCSASTVNRKLSAVASFYEFHARRGVTVGELLTHLKPSGGRTGAWRPFLAHVADTTTRRRAIKLPVPQRAPRDLTDSQVAAILASCDRLRDRFFIALLAGTGLRVGEALGLRHEDIDPAATTVRVRERENANGARAKSGPRQIPVPGELVRAYSDYLIEEYGDLDCDFVFVNLWSGQRGAPWRYWNVTDLVERLRRRSGVHFTVHMLRNTYATNLLRRGVGPEVVQKLLGHASITTTISTYAHLSVDDVRRSLEQSGWLPAISPVTISESAR